MQRTNEYKLEQTAVLRKHRKLLERPFSISSEIRRALTSEQESYLEKFGTWLKALSEGEVACLSDAQRHFVDSSNGKINPETFAECVWLKYQEIKADLGNATQARYTGPHGGTGGYYGIYSKHGLSSKDKK